MRGRKPNSAERNALTGNAGKRKVKGDALDAAPFLAAKQTSENIFDPPKNLSAAAQEKWWELVSYLAEQGLFRITDREVLKTLCIAITRRDMCQAFLEQNGYTYESVSKHGTLWRDRKEVGILERAERTILRASEQLAMTIVSRTRTMATGLQSRQYSLFDGQTQKQNQDKGADKAMPPIMDNGPVGIISNAVH